MSEELSCAVAHKEMQPAFEVLTLHQLSLYTQRKRESDRGREQEEDRLKSDEQCETGTVTQRGSYFLSRSVEVMPPLGKNMYLGRLSEMKKCESEEVCPDLA